MPTLTHPNLPGREIEVTDAAVPTHQRSGWTLKSDSEPAEVDANDSKDGE